MPFAPTPYNAKKAKIIIRGEKSNLHLPVIVQILLTSQSKNCVSLNSLNHPSRRCLHFLENNIHLFKLPCTIIWQWREQYLSSERIYKVTLYEHLFAPVVQASSDLSFTLATIIYWCHRIMVIISLLPHLHHALSCFIAILPFEAILYIMFAHCPSPTNSTSPNLL